MCCMVAALFMLGPRAGIFVWWLIQPARFAATFDTLLWPFLGFLFAPWTTLMYVAVSPGGIDGFDPIWLAIAVGLDFFTWFGGGFSNRNRMRMSGAA